MALVAQYWELVISFKDTGNDTAPRTYRLNEAAYADASADAAALLAATAALSDCAISAYSLNQKFIENALTLPANAQVENTGFFSGLITGAPNDSATADIPGIKSSVMSAPTGKGNNIVNMANSLVITWRDMFSPTGVASLSDGETWDEDTVSGKRVHKKNRNG